MGKACISRWLKPHPQGNANTCPMCRHKLFEPWPPASRTGAGFLDIPLSVRPIDAPAQARTLHSISGFRTSERICIEYHMQHLEAAGYTIGPFVGANERTWARERRVGVIEANRRRIASREKALYTTLHSLGVRLSLAEDRAWSQDEPLDYEQDRALFHWLQEHNAFRSLRLNEEYRKEKTGPRAGRARSNAEMWATLRDDGIFWELEARRHNGHWHNFAGPLYTDEDEDESDIFNELLLDGAFATRGIRRAFPGLDEYTMFRRILELRIGWDSRRKVWTRGRGPALFGDVGREL